MTLRARLIGGILGTVSLTSVAVAGTVAWLSGPERWLAVVGVCVLSMVAAVAAGRHWLLRPLEGQLASMASRIRHPGGSPSPLASPFGLDPGLSLLDDALDEVRRGLEQEAAEVRDTRRLASEVVEHSTVGIALLDTDGVFTQVNPAFRSMIPLRADPVGRRPLEVVALVEIHEVVQAGLRGQHEPVSFPTATSDLVVTSSVLADQLLLTVEDTTGQREAERARTDFVANVSHELRTPLTAIRGYLETILLDEERIPADILSMLHIVDRNALRLRDLFEDLLRLHRIEVRRRELPRGRVQLAPLLEEAIGAARDHATMRGQTFTLDCPANLTAVVNPEALAAIVGNLASNATNYTPEGGSVRVQVVEEPRQIRIDIVDDGIGIAPSQHERVFERFYRVDEARSRQVGGTGLGLAIVKHYALASGCLVALQSEVGAGTTFSVHLPAS